MVTFMLLSMMMMMMMMMMVMVMVMVMAMMMMPSTCLFLPRHRKFKGPEQAKVQVRLFSFQLV